MPTNDYSIVPNDTDLVLRLKNFEDHFVERKTIGDSKDWLKTAVAFANSAPLGFPCVLYIGVRNDGTPEQRQEHSNLEKLQASFADKIKVAYPRIAYYPRVFRVDNEQTLAIIIPGSELRPHFTQRPHVRSGERTLEATDAQFEELIGQRGSKVAYLLSHKAETFKVDFLNGPADSRMIGRVQSSWSNCKLVDCNQFFIVVEGENLLSVPLERIRIFRDTQANQLGSLRLEVLFD